MAQPSVWEISIGMGACPYRYLNRELQKFEYWCKEDGAEPKKCTYNNCQLKIINLKELLKGD